MSFKTEKERLSFREIALSHMKKILEISCIEFRGGFYKLVIQVNYSFKEYVPSTIKCYIQAVESFSDILQPHFDSKMEKINTTILKKIDGLRSKMIAEKQERIQKEYDLAIERHKDDPGNNREPNAIDYRERYDGAIVIGSTEESRLQRRKLDIMRIIFRELNLLLYRVDYLKSSIFGDDADEGVSEEDEK